MLSKLQSKRTKLRKADKGFTIIEVMIVLAIAGLIMLIVFLAVPALQRNSRNTNRRSDAARISSAVANFIANNNGTQPTTTAHAQAILDDAGNLGIYQGITAGAGPMAQGRLNVSAVQAITPMPAIAITGTAPTDAVEIVGAARCDPANPGTTINGTSRRSTAMLYTLEPGNGANYTIVCLDI